MSDSSAKTSDNLPMRSSCERCTRSHTKCDGGHPCGRCERLKHQCEYGVQRRRGRAGRKRSNKSSDSDDRSAKRRASGTSMPAFMSVNGNGAYIPPPVVDGTNVAPYVRSGPPIDTSSSAATSARILRGGLGLDHLAEAARGDGGSRGSKNSEQEQFAGDSKNVSNFTLDVLPAALRSTFTDDIPAIILFNPFSQPLSVVTHFTSAFQRTFGYSANEIRSPFFLKQFYSSRFAAETLAMIIPFLMHLCKNDVRTMTQTIGHVHRQGNIIMTQDQFSIYYDENGVTRWGILAMEPLVDEPVPEPPTAIQLLQLSRTLHVMAVALVASPIITSRLVDPSDHMAGANGGGTSSSSTSTSSNQESSSGGVSNRATAELGGDPSVLPGGGTAAGVDFSSIGGFGGAASSGFPSRMGGNMMGLWEGMM